MFYRGPEDIPSEYRVLTLPEPEPPVKVANADLTVLLTQMHALGGDYMTDARHNINVLEARRSPELLMLMTDKSIYLTGAAHAYREGTTAFDVFMNAAETPGAKAFALHVTDVHQDHVIGDLVEMDPSQLKEDIQVYSIQYTRIDATPKFGPDETYTPKQWEAMDAIDHDRLQSWTRHFEDKDLQSVIHHLQDVCNRHAEISGSVKPEAFLSDLNEAYMQNAENPQPDMFRITFSAARDILMNYDATVYRLLPEGPRELSYLDALPSRGGLWHQEPREFAIKKDGLTGLGKWADREAKALTSVRQPERAAPDKKKSHNAEL